MIKTTAQEIWSEFQRCKQYNAHIGLYETVKKNENFFIGRQWEGVNAGDIDTPVFNILKRSVSYFVANIVSDDISVKAEVYGLNETDPMYKMVKQTIENTVDEVIEASSLRDRMRDVLRDTAVDGDGCVHMYFDENREVGLQHAKGAIVIETLPNTNVLFADPTNRFVQEQPYVILYTRRNIDDVREEAKANGVNADDIKPDKMDSELSGADYSGDENCTVLIKYWKQDGEVWFTKVCKDTVIKKPTALGYRRYPVQWMNWDHVINSYHGEAAVTGMIPNQIYINKMFAMGMQFTKNTAFPKVIYNAALLDGWDNTPGSAIPVHGTPNDAVMLPTRSLEMSQSVLGLIERTINYTRDTMGATDAALGNVSPDNMGAIIAVQQAAAMPLELHRKAFYEFAENCVRSIVDIVSFRYGVRPVDVGYGGQNTQVMFNFDMLQNLSMRLKVTIGASAYWSEIMQVQTADNMFLKGILQDPRLYLEMIPDKYISNKAAIIRALDDAQAEQAALAGMGGSANEAMPAVQSGTANPAQLQPPIV